jgi:GT2 family glycosyltransferase
VTEVRSAPWRILNPRPAPILITAFNRPDRLARLLASLQADAPPVVRIAIDGPRNPGDRAAVEETRRVAETVAWACDLEVWAREANAGIATAIPEAVSRALMEFDRVFVIEDDVSVGPQAYEFMCRALDHWQTESTVSSVSAYNMVPVDHLSRPDDPVRLSRVMSSYVWGTWRERWTAYDPEMTWFAEQSHLRPNKVLRLPRGCHAMEAAPSHGR